MYQVDEAKVKTLTEMLEKTELQYERFCANGCSVHEYNRLKHNARDRLFSYVEGKGERYLRWAEEDIKALVAWVGKRVNVISTPNCTNCGKRRYGEGWKWYCQDCDKNN